MPVDRKTQVRDSVGEYKKRKGVASVDGPPRSAPYPIGEDHQSDDRQSQECYPDWKRKSERRKAHGDHRWIVQIEETRRSFIGDVHSQRRAQQEPGYVTSSFRIHLTEL